MIATLLILLVLGVVGVVAVGLLLAVVGTVFGIAVGVAGFLIFKVAPLLLVGYVMVRLLAPRRRRITDGRG